MPLTSWREGAFVARACSGVWLLAFVVLGALEWVLVAPGAVGEPRLFVALLRLAHMGFSTCVVAFSAMALFRRRFIQVIAPWLIAIVFAFAAYWFGSAQGDISYLFGFSRYVFWIVTSWAALALTEQNWLKQRDLAWAGASVLLATFGVAAWKWSRGELITGIINPEGFTAYTANEALNNAGYQAVAGMVLLFAGGRRRCDWNIIAGLAGLALVALSGKRGALLAGLLSALVFCWTAYRAKFVEAWKVVVTCAVSIIILFGVFVTFQSEIERRLGDLGDVDRIGSGRGAMYQLLWNDWLNGTPGEQLFGKGFEASVDVLGVGFSMGMLAHSDWLELLVDFGLLGVAWFLFFHALVLRRVLELFGKRDPRAIGLLACWAAYLPTTVYSFTLTGYNTGWFGIVFGFAFASERGRKQGQIRR